MRTPTLAEDLSFAADQIRTAWEAAGDERGEEMFALADRLQSHADKLTARNVITRLAAQMKLPRSVVRAALAAGRLPAGDPMTPPPYTKEEEA